MRILIVDDSALARAAIRRELESAGYEVEEAASGEAALERLSAVGPSLVTLDVRLAGSDGFETCRRIRALELLQEGAGPGLPIVFVTAEDTLAWRIEGFRAGATDFLLKPLAPGSAQRVVDALLRAAPGGAPLTALVVEDSPLVRRIVCAALEQLGLRLVQAGDGEEALGILRADPTGVQLVVTDYVMPRLWGDALCRAIREDAALAHLPVLVASAVEQIADLVRIFRAGASDFVPKPFVKEVFQARVAGLLGGTGLDAELLRRAAAPHGETGYRQALQRFGPHGPGHPFSQSLLRADGVRSMVRRPGWRRSDVASLSPLDPAGAPPSPGAPGPDATC